MDYIYHKEQPEDHQMMWQDASLHAREPDIYYVPADTGYNWKDGYNYREAVLFDNLSIKDITNPSRFLMR